MDIFVAGAAAIEEAEVLVLDMAGGGRQPPMTLRAGYLLMEACQNEGCFVVGKAWWIFPRFNAVTARAICTKISMMVIRVAIVTCWR